MLGGMVMEKQKKYYQITLPETELQCVYSAEAMEKTLNSCLKNQKLCKLFIFAYGNPQYAKMHENQIDGALMAGSIVLVFDNKVVELYIGGKGIMEYRTLSLQEMTITEVANQANIAWNEGVYCDMATELSPEYEGQSVEEIAVEKTGEYPFKHNDFDLEKLTCAAQKKELPSSLSFVLENGNVLKFLGDDIEYYVVAITKN